MDKMPLISIIFYSLPEAYLIFSFGLIALGQKINVIRVILATVFFVLSSYIIRMLPFPFGMHTAIGIAIIFLFFMIILRLKAKHALIATLISSGTLIALENSILYLFQIELNLTPKQIWQDPLMRTLIGWPHLLVWSLITLIIYKRKIHIVRCRGNLEL
ncbi:hypothetical protein Dtox_0384 [Desulfofarcimen acetoxidans DSM 771]|uniref:Uncharacterized protein n=1 Tax=Desulfofarcimen acetoxidans (strain ATCC 49208 / DSM 771 / KCTC 5769 / VKM B-1644 / 5575) TaxID=485916 RepID=C8W4X7_DESAS|nr:hypothetical protein [Desulfofarcimen acetoxidans]ACV61329.1 hypothetical protein Dtox_0384 [Desulfofarcimen acetoxidans DSM 771]